ncbi:MAG: signal peptidase I [Candidatus Izimaplasma sp.]|nr:signal peptidase I [Candidatus Izimaplasma bacterium]
MKKHIGKFFIYLIYTLLISYIVITVFFPNKSTDILGFRTFVVISDSMEPKINVYDMVVIKKVDKEDIQVSDIITFKVYIPEVDSKSYVTHYVDEIIINSENETIYKTQGESTAENPDVWTDADGNVIDISYNDVEGVYLFKIPKIGRLIYLLRDPIFVGLLIVNGFVIYFVYKYIKKLLFDAKNEKKD